MQNDAGSDYLALTYTQLSGGAGVVGADYTVDGISYFIETNNDLGAVWHSGASYTDLVGIPVPIDPFREQVTVRLVSPISPGIKQFVRLTVME